MRFIAHQHAAKILGIVLLLALLISSGLTSTLGAQAEPALLARIDVSKRLDKLGLPIYAHLRDARGREYALSIATRAQLEHADATYQILDSYTTGTTYAIVEPHRRKSAPAIPTGLTVIHNDGLRWLVRMHPTLSESVLAMGYHLRWLDDTPMVLRVPEVPIVSRAAVPPHPSVTKIIADVKQDTVYAYVGNLSGENPVTIGGSSYTITTRATASGTPIEKATQYVYEFMQAQGLTVSYHPWSSGSYSGRNVVAEKRGTTRPNEIVVVGAHLDSRPYSGPAPGADDNASGSVALMLAGETFRNHSFERTIRFVFFTGEEQGLYGSSAYAAKMVSDRANVVAMLNMDMIAYDSVNRSEVQLTTRSTSNPGYAGDKAIADVYVDVVNSYGLSSVLKPIISPNGSTSSDHASFWSRGFSALYEEEKDFSDYWHTAGDKRSTLNMAFLTNTIKASLGTVAHLAYPAGTGTTPTPSTVTPVTRTPTPVTRTPTPVTITPSTPTPGGAIFVDDFESDKGWTRNPSGSDTATSGQWERGDPEATDYSGAKQLGTTVSGSNDLVTGRLAGSSAGAYDLDGGLSSMQSPSITLPSGSNPQLSFSFYIAHASNSSTDDFLRVSVLGGTPDQRTVVFEKKGAATNTNAAWQTASADLSLFAGQSIRLLIEASDTGIASLFEAAVDDVRITGGTTTTPTPTPVADVFNDTFETNQGWSINPNGSDTATSGQFERGIPETTDYSGAKQIAAASASYDLVTGRLAGSSAGAYDLDGGLTSARSPTISLPSGNLRLAFKYYLAHATNSSTDDFLRISVIEAMPTGQRTVVFEKKGAAANVNAAWQSGTADLSPFAGQTIYLLIETSDAGAASLLEAAIDDVVISRSDIPDRQ